MAVAVQLDFKGGTLEQYDKVMDVMAIEPAGSVPPGALFHWVAQTEDGIRVQDVWSDRETFERYAAESIGPSMHAAGVDLQPEIMFLELHNYLPSSP